MATDDTTPDTAVQWMRRPDLDGPVVVVAFAGWNDAGDAATWAVRHLSDRMVADPFAEIDGEVFFDFTETRPTVELDGDIRTLTWPTNEFTVASDANLVLLRGVEPQLRWRTFAESVIGVAQALGASMVVSLGALLSDTPHSRPVTVYGSSSDPELTERLGLDPSSYEGPTGIVGVISSMCAQADIPTASFWAAVPNYVSGAASPKAALALVERLEDVLGFAVPSTDLEIASAAYERQINELVEADTDLVAFIADLEAQYDDGELDESELDDSDPDAFVEEVEQFLREQE